MKDRPFYMSGYHAPNNVQISTEHHFPSNVKPSERVVDGAPRKNPTL